MQVCGSVCMPFCAFLINTAAAEDRLLPINFQKIDKENRQ